MEKDTDGFKRLFLAALAASILTTPIVAATAGYYDRRNLKELSYIASNYLRDIVSLSTPLLVLSDPVRPLSNPQVELADSPILGPALPHFRSPAGIPSVETSVVFDQGFKLRIIGTAFSPSTELHFQILTTTDNVGMPLGIGHPSHRNVSLEISPKTDVGGRFEAKVPIDCHLGSQVQFSIRWEKTARLGYGLAHGLAC